MTAARHCAISSGFWAAAALAGAVVAARAQTGPLQPAGIPTTRTVDPRPAVAQGQVAEYRIASRAFGRERRIWVYTPPGYAPGADTAYGLVVAFDGGEYLDTIPLPMILDTLLAAGQAPPCVAVLIDDSTSQQRLNDLANHARFVTFLGDEVMPWVRAHWRVTHDPGRTIVTGSSAGGLAAIYAALRRPDLFGNVLSQSGALWRGNEGSNSPPYEWLTGRYATAPRQQVRFFLDVGALETRGAMRGAAPSLLEANRRLRDVLRTRGYMVTYTEVPDGNHAPWFWKLRLPNGIVTLTHAPPP